MSVFAIMSVFRFFSSLIFKAVRFFKDLFSVIVYGGVIWLAYDLGLFGLLKRLISSL